MKNTTDRNPALAAARWIFVISLVIAAVVMAIPVTQPVPGEGNLLSDPAFRVSYPEEDLGPWKLRSGSTGVLVRSLPVPGGSKKRSRDRVIRVLFSPSKPGVFRLSQTCNSDALKGNRAKFTAGISTERLTGDVVFRLISTGRTLVEKAFTVASSGEPGTLSVEADIPANSSRVIAIIEAESTGGILWLHNADLHLLKVKSPASRDTASARIFRQPLLRRFHRLARDFFR